MGRVLATWEYGSKMVTHSIWLRAIKITVTCGAVIASGAAALTRPYLLTAQMLNSTICLLLLVCVVAALYGRGRWRAAAGGFALCAGAYFVLLHSPYAASIKPHLLTTTALNAAWPDEVIGVDLDNDGGPEWIMDFDMFAKSGTGLSLAGRNGAWFASEYLPPAVQISGNVKRHFFHEIGHSTLR